MFEIIFAIFIFVIFPFLVAFLATRFSKEKSTEKLKEIQLNQGNKKPIISVDIPWDQIKGEFCRVKVFLPFGQVKGNKIIAPPISKPYAILDVENPKKLPPQGAFLPIFHKLDFKHLWEAFKERGVKEEEEVLVIYSPEPPPNFPESTAKIFESSIFPKFHIWICKKGFLEKLYDETPKDSIEMAKFLLKEWTPFDELEKKVDY